MKRAVFGVVGHVDHGKTALVKALTGQDTDRLPEEKARGISIALGFAHFATGNAAIDLIDAPGHERFVRTMIAGASGFDALLLVVAADEGIKPQTIEHVSIAGLLGIGRGVVAITKADLVSTERMAQVGRDAIALLGEAEIAADTFVPTSSVTGQGIDALRAALAHHAMPDAERASDGVAWLPIDRAFTIVGHGPVITGTLQGAAVDLGDMMTLWPAERPVRLRGVQVHGTAVERAPPGQRVALNLRDVELRQLHAGMALAPPGALTRSEWLTISLHMLPAAPPLRNGIRVQALVGTSEVEARPRILDSDVAEAGATTVAQLRLAEPLAFPARVPVILRLPAPIGTIAGGIVLDPQAVRLRRRAARTIERLERLRLSSREAIVRDEALSRHGTTTAMLSRLTALSRENIAALLGGLPVVEDPGGFVIARDRLDHLVGQIRSKLAVAPAGLPIAGLGLTLKAPQALVELAARALTGAGAAVRKGDRLSLPHVAADRTRAREEAAAADAIAAVLRDAGLSPPLPAELGGDAGASRAIERLIRAGTIVRAVDRAKGKVLLFHRDAIADARARLAPLLAAEPGLLVTEIAAALGLSRKFVMPLLDHLDAICFTRRVGDRRILHEGQGQGRSPIHAGG